MTSLPSTVFATGHVGLNVSDLERSRDFYGAVFGLAVQYESSDESKRYAFLGDGDFDAGRPGLHHLSFEVPDIDDVRAAEERVRAAGGRLHHGGIVPHAEGRSSGGIFFEDPDGIRLEIYTGSGAEGHAPTGAAPTCGFF